MATRPQALAIARVAGLAWYLVAPSARQAVRANLRHVVGGRPRESLVRAAFFHGALNYVDTIALPHHGEEWLRSLVDVEGMENIEAARRAGHGAVIVSAHLGSVALAGQAVRAAGYPIVVVVERLASREVFDFMAQHRAAFGARMIPADSEAVRILLKALRDGELVGLISDRNVTGTGQTVPFFGESVLFPTGPAALAVRTGAPALVGVTLHEPGGRFRVIVEPEPPYERTGDLRVDVPRLTQALAGRLEYHIARHPEQWTVFQERWPSRRAR